MKGPQGDRFQVDPRSDLQDWLRRAFWVCCALLTKFSAPQERGQSGEDGEK